MECQFNQFTALDWSIFVVMVVALISRIKFLDRQGMIEKKFMEWFSEHVIQELIIWGLLAIIFFDVVKINSCGFMFGFAIWCVVQVFFYVIKPLGWIGNKIPPVTKD